MSACVCICVRVCVCVCVRVCVCVCERERGDAPWWKWIWLRFNLDGRKKTQIFGDNFKAAAETRRKLWISWTIGTPMHTPFPKLWHPHPCAPPHTHTHTLTPRAEEKEIRTPATQSQFQTMPKLRKKERNIRQTSAIIKFEKTWSLRTLKKVGEEGKEEKRRISWSINWIEFHQAGN